MKRILISLVALMLVFSMSAAAFAEGTGTTSLTEAQTAYTAAKQAASLTDYETELKAMVEAGSLTQEQADLLLTAVNEANALRSGVCPSCGYQFQTVTGKANHTHGKSGRTMKVMGRTSGIAATETTALEQAQAAYAAAKQTSQMSAYEAELTTMVEAGTLTQEQADALLSAAKEAEALANGTCPSCGYAFQTTSAGHNGRANGFGMGMKNGIGRGGKR